MMILSSKHFVQIILILYLATQVAPKCDYKKFTRRHSALKRAACKNFKPVVTDAEKRKILKKHNGLRAKIARGEEHRGNPGPQPNGANIRELKWNNELARVAQAWANQCKISHDCKECRKICSRNYAVGQNFFTSFTKSFKENSIVWDAAIQSWYNKVEFMSREVVSKYRKKYKGKFVGHYTQMIWAETNEIGCGAVHFRDKGTRKMYVCNYGPAGNEENKQVYMIGAPASKCPGPVSKTYSGLCI